MDKPKTEAEAIAELLAALAKLAEITTDNIKLMHEATKAIYGITRESAEERLRKGEEGEP